LVTKTGSYGIRLSSRLVGGKSQVKRMDIMQPFCDQVLCQEELESPKEKHNVRSKYNAVL
jgi:hypothetical protein